MRVLEAYVGVLGGEEVGGWWLKVGDWWLVDGAQGVRSIGH